MCGIAGILNLNGERVVESEVRAITRALAHRGPDGEGVLAEGAVGLGHRRLAILDLSQDGKQPMRLIGDRYWITYNGEIYNFLELRKDLEAKGYSFTSQTDTEVIVAAYDCWGADCVLKFNGMWAFAIWDKQERELFLSRDRFGVKPLHYLNDGSRFVFASELKAFLHLAGFTPRENEHEVRRALLAGAPEAGEETFVEGIKRLQGGHNMRVSSRGTKIWKWWSTLEHLPQVPSTFKAQAAELKELFFDACRLRLRSDVPVATCLSGGLDSSSVICSLAEIRKESGRTDRRAKDSHRAFVATYPGTPWDESEYARSAATKANADVRFKPITPELAAEAIEQYAFDFEGISYSLLVPLWLIYRELRRDGVYVSMDGHGADEILCGYPSTIRDTLRNSGSVVRSPARTLDLIRTVQAMSSSGAVSTSSFAAMVVDSDPWLRKASAMFRRITTRPPPPDAAKTNAWNAPMTETVNYLDANEAEAVEALGPMNKLLYMDFHHKVLPGILRNFDRCSMAHGVEMRMPFMDWRLVCYSFALPEEAKAGGGFSKRILREAMTGVLPEDVRQRRGKIGFVSPMPNWFNAGLGEWVRAQVNSTAFLTNEMWNGPVIRDFAETRLKAKSWNGEDTKRIWRYLQAHVWRESFLGRRRPTAMASATAD